MNNNQLLKIAIIKTGSTSLKTKLSETPLLNTHCIPLINEQFQQNVNKNQNNITLSLTNNNLKQYDFSEKKDVFLKDKYKNIKNSHQPDAEDGSKINGIDLDILNHSYKKYMQQSDEQIVPLKDYTKYMSSIMQNIKLSRQKLKQMFIPQTNIFKKTEIQIKSLNPQFHYLLKNEKIPEKNLPINDTTGYNNKNDNLEIIQGKEDIDSTEIPLQKQIKKFNLLVNETRLLCSDLSQDVQRIKKMHDFSTQNKISKKGDPQWIVEYRFKYKDDKNIDSKLSELEKQYFDFTGAKMNSDSQKQSDFNQNLEIRYIWSEYRKLLLKKQELLEMCDIEERKIVKQNQQDFIAPLPLIKITEQEDFIQNNKNNFYGNQPRKVFAEQKQKNESLQELDFLASMETEENKNPNFSLEQTIPTMSLIKKSNRIQNNFQTNFNYPDVISNIQKNSSIKNLITEKEKNPFKIKKDDTTNMTVQSKKDSENSMVKNEIIKIDFYELEKEINKKLKIERFIKNQKQYIYLCVKQKEMGKMISEVKARYNIVHNFQSDQILQKMRAKRCEVWQDELSGISKVERQFLQNKINYRMYLEKQIKQNSVNQSLNQKNQKMSKKTRQLKVILEVSKQFDKLCLDFDFKFGETRQMINQSVIGLQDVLRIPVGYSTSTKAFLKGAYNKTGFTRVLNRLEGKQLQQQKDQLEQSNNINGKFFQQLKTGSSENYDFIYNNIGNID